MLVSVIVYMLYVAVRITSEDYRDTVVHSYSNWIGRECILKMGDLRECSK